jgi:hypothetical protein
MALMYGPGTPYVTPDQLQQRSTGVSWASIPSVSATPGQRYAAQQVLCQDATAMVDGRCNQLLRATIQTEQLFGPDFRVNQLPNGNTRLTLSQWPILQVTGIRVANASSFPWQFTSVVNGAWAVERPPLLVYNSSAAADSGTGGQSVQLGPGYVNWLNNRGGWVIETTYAAGWPHAGITGDADAGDITLDVDDCTGWAPATAGAQGCTGVIYDTGGNQEPVTCLAASAVQGPGTLSLASGLLSDHAAGVTVSALPGQAQWATVLYAASLALTRGATATKIQDIAGTGGASASGSADLAKQADTLLTPFRRVI